MNKLKEFTIDNLNDLINLINKDLDILSLYGVYELADYSLDEVDFNLNPYVINLIYKIPGNIYAGFTSIPYIEIDESGNETKGCLNLSGPNYMIIYQKVQWFIVSHIFGCIKPI